MPIINQIVKGSGGSGTVPDYYLKRVVDGSGKIIFDSAQTTVSTSPATDVGNFVLYGWICNNGKTVGVDCSSLINVSGQNALALAFSNDTITSYDFSNLETVTGANAFDQAFAYSGGTNSISFPKLTTVGASGFSSALASSLFTSASLPALTSVGNMGLYNAFGSSTVSTVTLGGTTAITFGTSALQDMFAYVNQDVTVNAPLASKSDIEAMSGYPDFGADYNGYTVTWNWVS